MNQEKFLLNVNKEKIDSNENKYQQLYKEVTELKEEIKCMHDTMIYYFNKLERLSKVQLPNSFVHLSAYSPKGNAGDNILVPALRDSITQISNLSISWCHKSVRDVLDDETVELINASRGLIIGGGGLFLKDTNYNEISGWQFPCPIDKVSKINVPIIMLGVGYNRFRGQDDFEPYFRDNINEFVKRAKFIGLRNRGSIEAIQKYLDTKELKKKIYFHPCATTILSKLYRMPKLDGKKPIIAVNCAFDRSHFRYVDKKERTLLSIAKAIKIFSDKFDIKYYAHMRSDKEILPYLDEQKINYDVVMLNQGLNVEDFLQIYSEPTLVLAMRGHAQLISFGCGTPVLSIISHDKLQWFLEDIEHPEWGVDVLEEDFENKLIRTMQYILSNLSVVRQEIEEAKEQLWEISKSNIENIFADFKK